MNVDAITNMVTTFLNDFATFWSNIWEFLKPIFNMANPDGWTKLEGLEGDQRKDAHLSNLNNLANSFGDLQREIPEGYTPTGSADNK